MYRAGSGFVYVISAVENCLAQGCTELEDISYDHQRKIMLVQDQILSMAEYW
jgi:hypothetical protein